MWQSARVIEAGPGLRAALRKSPDAHKYDHGHALVLSGGAGRTGAARLAARAALRIGAGLVTLGVPAAAEHEVACQITALMMRRIEDGADLAAALADRRLNALCLGPGLGPDRAPDLVRAALADPARAVVLDADALTGFAESPEALFERLHPGAVLTPHRGEFARLFPDLAGKDASADLVRQAARRAGAVLLLKGAETWIAAPDGRAWQHAALGARAAPWLATAGSGDVLAGFIAGLLARGLPAAEAAGYATFLHAECGRLAGPGLIAEDLPETLPAVMRDLGL